MAWESTVAKKLVVCVAINAAAAQAVAAQSTCTSDVAIGCLDQVRMYIVLVGWCSIRSYRFIYKASQVRPGHVCL